MADVQPGDIVFSYFRRNIVAISVVRAAAVTSQRPGEFGEGSPWENDGRRVDLSYRDLNPPLPVQTILEAIRPHLPERYSPLQADGAGNQGYLFALPARAARILLDAVGAPEHPAGDDLLERAIATADATERVALTKSRIGQGIFRDQLLELWRGKCCVTGLSVRPLLRASHIKPWRDSNNAERLHRFNGLLLSPNYDAAFDEGLVTFADDGHIIISAALPAHELAPAGISLDARIQALRHDHLPFLRHHREEVFIGASARR